MATCHHRGRGMCKQCRLDDLYEEEYERMRKQREAEDGEEVA